MLDPKMATNILWKRRTKKMDVPRLTGFLPRDLTRAF